VTGRQPALAELRHALRQCEPQECLVIGSGCGDEVAKETVPQSSDLPWSHSAGAFALTWASPPSEFRALRSGRFEPNA